MLFVFDVGDRSGEVRLLLLLRGWAVFGWVDGGADSFLVLGRQLEYVGLSL